MDHTFFFTTRQMSVGYDGKALIRDIEIKLPRGEILTLIGPNGAGKSTILKSITRQLRLIQGSTWLDLRQMQQMSGKEIARRLAVVLTERIRPELMTCEDVVSTGRYPYTGNMGILSPEDKRKVSQAMELVHASELKDRDFSETSDGQKQRILLARAICQEPELIILDEPTSFLDVRHKLEFLSILKKMVKEQNVAVIMSLHELDLAQKISDQVMCVSGDQIQRYGRPEEIFEENYIRDLYQISTGAYDALFGCMELSPVSGTPEVFVIGGDGNAVPVYRKLQRQRIPFVTGILQENDVDCHAAGYLTEQIISVPAFEPVREEDYQRALAVMKECRKVICCVQRFGSLNDWNRMLKEEAQKMGILCDAEDIN